eukprot:scaffold7923_cov154-Skeletonema_menzelii.AAC.5
MACGVWRVGKIGTLATQKIIRDCHAYLPKLIHHRGVAEIETVKPYSGASTTLIYLSGHNRDATTS